jgi:hypothetical protein
MQTGPRHVGGAFFMESTMAEQNADLLKQAEELGIKVDGRWKDDRIQSEIDAKLSEAPHERSDPLDHDGDGKKGGTAPAIRTIRTTPFVTVAAKSWNSPLTTPWPVSNLALCPA